MLTDRQTDGQKLTNQHKYTVPLAEVKTDTFTAATVLTFYLSASTETKAAGKV